jgi:hypothetical protein
MRGGDAIVFSSERAKPEPAGEVPTTKGESNLRQRLPSANPASADGIRLPGPRAVGPAKKTKEERLRQAERDEKRNWLLLRPGELQEREKEKQSQGIPDYDLEKPEPEGGRRDYTFYGLAEARSARSQNASGQARKDHRDASQARAADSGLKPGTDDQAEDEQKSDSDSTGAKPKTERELGAHASSELNLSGLLDPTQTKPAASEPSKGELTLKDFLSSSSTSMRTREQQNRLNEFNQTLNGPKMATLGPGLANAASLQAKPAPPAPSRSLALPDPSGGSKLLMSAPTLEGFASIKLPPSPGLPDLNSPKAATFSQRPSAGSSLNTVEPPPNRPSIMRPLVIEIPQRKF